MGKKRLIYNLILISIPHVGNNRLKLLLFSCWCVNISCFPGERAAEPRSDGHGVAENRCQIAWQQCVSLDGQHFFLTYQWIQNCCLNCMSANFVCLQCWKSQKNKKKPWSLAKNLLSTCLSWYSWYFDVIKLIRMGMVLMFIYIYIHTLYEKLKNNIHLKQMIQIIVFWRVCSICTQ